MAVLAVPERELTILDDSYNANPASVRQALLTAAQVRTAGERLLVVLGDMLELGTLSSVRHREMGEVVAGLNPRPDLLITVGHEARALAAQAQAQGVSVRTFGAAAEAADFIRDTVEHYAGPQLVLVKGSRGVQLEIVTRALGVNEG